MEEAPYFSEIADGPSNAASYWSFAKDGLRLRMGHWKPVSKAIGTILFFPGRTEYIELYGRTASEFCNLGYSMLAIDWRGHGLSDRIADDHMMMHVGQYADYQKDVAEMIAAATRLNLPKPWFLVGNSLGGNIGLRALTEGLPVAACAFSGPMWGIKLSALQRFAIWPVSWIATAIGKGQTYCPGYDGQNYASNSPFEGNRLTNDADMFRYWANQAKTHPELQTGGPSMSWILGGLEECRDLARSPSPSIPCISFYGEQDEVVDLGAIQSRMKLWPQSNFEIVRNSKHEIFLESPTIRKHVLSKIHRFFEQARD